MFTYVSPSVKNVLGYTQQEFLSHYTKFISDRPSNTLAHEYTHGARKDELIPAYEVEWVHSNGGIRVLLVSESCLFDNSGRVIEIEGIAQDITDRHLAEKKLKDEFIVIMGNIHDSNDAAILAADLLEIFTRSISVEQQELYLTASIGISLYPQDGGDVATLLKNADAAMYRAKKQGRNNYQFYTPEYTLEALERVRIESNLRRALLEAEFQIYYQPQIRLDSGQIVGAEALVRWQHPDMGMIPPTKFIHIAEQSGQIVQLSEWVLRSACAQWVRWQRHGLSINGPRGDAI